MRMVVSALLAFIWATTGLAATQRVGSFTVTSEKDAFGDGDKYIAIMDGGGGSLVLRCLNGEANAAFFATSSRAEVGADVDIQFRLDDGEIKFLTGTALNRSSFGQLVQFGDADLIREFLVGPRRAAIKYELGGVTKSFSLAVRGADKVAAAALTSCGESAARPVARQTPTLLRRSTVRSENVKAFAIAQTIATAAADNCVGVGKSIDGLAKLAAALGVDPAAKGDLAMASQKAQADIDSRQHEIDLTNWCIEAMEFYGPDGAVAPMILVKTDDK